MSQCVVPNWNLRHQRQEQVEGEEGNRSSHWHTQQSSLLFPMSSYEVAELTWENGQLAMHGLGATAQPKPSWAQAGDTLESVIHQATRHKKNPNSVDFEENPTMMDSVVASSGGKWAENTSDVGTGLQSTKKCSRTESGPCRRHHTKERADRSASGSATFCRDTDTTMMTWTSLESLPSLKTCKTTEENSACRGRLENHDEEPETKGETLRSLSTRRSRAATVHNQSERRRRDRINQKMKALQKLVPNSSKTDKASMLDEVIEYLKQLQAQVQIMSIRNMNMPQMMMPMGMQQHLQMSLLARMGMGMGLGMGMGMLDMNSIARTASQPVPPLLHPTSVAAAAAPTFVSPPFVVPPMMPTHTTSPMNSELVSNTPIPMHDPRYAFLTQQQSMNMDLYNKMAALYHQQVNQTTQAMSTPSQANHMERE